MCVIVRIELIFLDFSYLLHRTRNEDIFQLKITFLVVVVVPPRFPVPFICVPCNLHSIYVSRSVVVVVVVGAASAVNGAEELCSRFCIFQCVARHESHFKG